MRVLLFTLGSLKKGRKNIGIENYMLSATYCCCTGLGKGWTNEEMKARDHPPHEVVSLNAMLGISRMWANASLPERITDQQPSLRSTGRRHGRRARNFPFVCDGDSPRKASDSLALPRKGCCGFEVRDMAGSQNQSYHFG